MKVGHKLAGTFGALLRVIAVISVLATMRCQTDGPTDLPAELRSRVDDMVRLAGEYASVALGIVEPERQSESAGSGRVALSGGVFAALSACGRTWTAAFAYA